MGSRLRSSAIPRRALATLGLALALVVVAVPAHAVPPPKERPFTVARACDLVARHAEVHGLPKPFFARLIWKESRFDPNAVSPAGAEGIAQFMPGTARLRRLTDSFDPDAAIPASAAYLAELTRTFGNLGLAAAAYNSGEGRVSRWLARGGFLPLETENYVLDIMGEPVDAFSDRTYAGTVRPLQNGRSFEESCLDLPIIRSATRPMSAILAKPWGIQIAGNVRRDIALRQYDRLKGRYAKLLAAHEPVVSRVRSARFRGGIHAVRIGADSRIEADRICAALRSAGGSCVVLRNR